MAIELAADLSFEVATAAVSLEMLYIADEIFMPSTAAEKAVSRRRR